MDTVLVVDRYGRGPFPVHETPEVVGLQARMKTPATVGSPKSIQEAFNAFVKVMAPGSAYRIRQVRCCLAPQCGQPGRP